MCPIVEHQVKITLSEEDIKKIIAEHLNENKSKYGVKEVFRAENVSINWEQVKGHMVFDSITALSKTTTKI